jgi:hypothetical protein
VAATGVVAAGLLAVCRANTRVLAFTWGFR